MIYIFCFCRFWCIYLCGGRSSFLFRYKGP